MQTLKDLIEVLNHINWPAAIVLVAVLIVVAYLIKRFFDNL